MNKILVAVDAANPVAMRAAVAEAARIHAQGRVEVHLLNVQPAVSGHVAMFFEPRELLALQHAAGAEDLAPAQALLRGANVPFVSSVRIGRCAETIARTARELGCDRIVLGRDDSEAVGRVGRIFGSLAQQVRHLVTSGDCRVIGA